MKKVLADNSSSGYQLAKSLYTDIDPPHVRKKLFENFIIYGNLIGSPSILKQGEIWVQYSLGDFVRSHLCLQPKMHRLLGRGLWGGQNVHEL